MVHKVLDFICHPWTVFTFDFVNPKWSMYICNIKKNSFSIPPKHDLDRYNYRGCNAFEMPFLNRVG